MGITIYPGGTYFSYLGFEEFRKRAAEAEGITLDRMEGYTDLYPIRWSTVKTPLRVFLAIPDAQGEMSPTACSIARPRLKEIVEAFSEGPMKEAGIGLLEGMAQAIEAGRPLNWE